MKFKPAVWYPIAIALTVANTVAVWFAAAPPGGPSHAAIHAGLAVVFGVWAQHLRQRPADGEFQSVLDAVEIETEALRHELAETRERLDFAERMLAREADPLRVKRSPE